MTSTQLVAHCVDSARETKYGAFSFTLWRFAGLDRMLWRSQVDRDKSHTEQTFEVSALWIASIALYENVCCSCFKQVFTRAGEQRGVFRSAFGTANIRFKSIG